MEGASRRGWIGAVACAFVLACLPAAASAQVPGRDADPVVLTGASLPTLAGADPTDVVAFRWTGSVWDQVPVQVDERAAVPFNQIYNNAVCSFPPKGTGAETACASPHTFRVPRKPGRYELNVASLPNDFADKVSIKVKKSKKRKKAAGGR